MPGSFLEVESRTFKPMAVSGLEKEVRDAVNAALKAMSSWRSDIADTSEYNGKRVIEKMAAAAAELGWPEQIVDAALVHMQSITEMQIQTLDHVMDVWEEQLKLPNPTAVSPSAKTIRQGAPGFHSDSRCMPNQYCFMNSLPVSADQSFWGVVRMKVT